MQSASACWLLSLGWQAVLLHPKYPSSPPPLYRVCLLNWGFKTITFCKKRVLFKAEFGKGAFKKWLHFYFKTCKTPKKLPINSQENLIKVGVLIRPSCKKFKWREGEGKRFLSKQVRRARENKSNEQSLRWPTWRSRAWRKEEAVGQRTAGVYSSRGVSRVCDFNHKLLNNTVCSFSFTSSPSHVHKSPFKPRGWTQVHGWWCGWCCLREEEYRQRGCFTAPWNYQNHDEKRQLLTQVSVRGWETSGE